MATAHSTARTALGNCATMPSPAMFMTAPPCLAMSGRITASLGLAVLLAAIAAIGAWRFWPRETLESDGMPTVAVLPFNGGSDPEQIDFARSLTREVSAYLSTFPGAHTLAIPELGGQALPQRAGATIRGRICARWRRGEGRRKDPCLRPPDRRRHGGKPVVRSLRLRGLRSARDAIRNCSQDLWRARRQLRQDRRPKWKRRGANRTATSPTMITT